MSDLSLNAALIHGSNSATRRRDFSLGYNNAEAGDVVVLAASNLWVPGSAANGANGTNFGATVGILESGGNNGQPATVIIEDPALNVGSGLTNGIPYFASRNAGNIGVQADLGAGNGVVFLGVARSPSVLFFKPAAAGATL